MMSLIIDSRLAEIRRAADFVEALCRDHGLPQSEANAINVLLDEIASNPIRHGLGEAGSHRISVALRVRSEEDGSRAVVLFHFDH